MLTFELLDPIRFPLAKKYYKSMRINVSVASHDLVLVAKTNEIVAIARLTPVDNHWLLTGVHVSESVRGQGIASKLVNTLCENQSTVFTFALEHLTTLYQGCGFEIIVPADIPCELAQRFNAYVKQGRK
ncbi:MAG: GNAT family N-acetyltransferase, partial [Psychrobium sp.]